MRCEIVVVVSKSWDVMLSDTVNRYSSLGSDEGVWRN
jgi:hypothetical protein